jgi:hypothetical protein
MTRRSSVRAAARENYCALTASACGGGEKKEPPSHGFGAASLTAQNLTEKVRALYEGSAVPVAKIAALAGVTERTIYKYAAKHGWKRRYRWAPRGADQDLAAAPRGRRWRPSPDFAPAKGAGARFIRRADKDKPIAAGLKATDPAGALRAAADCDAAAQRGAAALAEAEEEQMFEERTFMFRFINKQLAALERHLAQPGSPPLDSPAPDAMRDLYLRNVTWACDVLEDLRQERAATAAQSEHRTPAADAPRT